MGLKESPDDSLVMTSSRNHYIGCRLSNRFTNNVGWFVLFFSRGQRSSGPHMFIRSELKFAHVLHDRVTFRVEWSSEMSILPRSNCIVNRHSDPSEVFEKAVVEKFVNKNIILSCRQFESNYLGCFPHSCSRLVSYPFPYLKILKPIWDPVL